MYRVHSGGVSYNTETLDAAYYVLHEKTRVRDPERYARLPGRFYRDLGRRKCLDGLPGAGRRELAAAVRRTPGDLAAWRWLAISLLGTRAARVLVRAKAAALGRYRSDSA